MSAASASPLPVNLVRCWKTPPTLDLLEPGCHERLIKSLPSSFWCLKTLARCPYVFSSDLYYTLIQSTWQRTIELIKCFVWYHRPPPPNILPNILPRSWMKNFLSSPSSDHLILCCQLWWEDYLGGKIYICGRYSHFKSTQLCLSPVGQVARTCFAASHLSYPPLRGG